MKRLRFSRCITALALAILLTPGRASAQGPDTLSISGTFQMYNLQGTVGPDLAAVFANGNDHGWTLTLHGVTWSHNYSLDQWFDEWGNFFSDERYFTNVYATSYDFRFIGADADVLNAVVSSQLVGPSPTHGPLFTLWNGNYYDYNWSGPYARWALVLLPLDFNSGVLFSAGGWDYGHLFADDDGYPLSEPQRVSSNTTEIIDRRPGSNGSLRSYNDIVDIGSSAPPVLPPPPPTLSIADGTLPEGNKGTTRLDLTVTLSWSSIHTVTVDYQTAYGTALTKYDYTATSGTLAFQPGQTSRTISVSIKGDRTREPDETFSVRLSDAAGATIGDGVATVTILNDD